MQVQKPKTIQKDNSNIGNVLKICLEMLGLNANIGLSHNISAKHQEVIVRTKTIETMLETAKTARNNAYAPYSNFKVGAAILADNGEIYSGCNVENAAYPLGQCAEASAISAMIAGGGKKIDKILIVKQASGKIAPCGGCRQKISEFATDNTEILVQNKNGKITSYNLQELLPIAFGKKDLG